MLTVADLTSDWQGKLFYFASDSQLNLTKLIEIYPDKSKAQFLFYLCFMICLALCLFVRKLPEPTTRLLLLVVGLLTQTGFYIQKLGYLDEVYVNLVHPYNLYHSGKYSFQSDSLIDGTVEYFYYLLLTPFAKTRETLVIAAFVLGWIVSLLHLMVIAKIFRKSELLIFTIAIFLTAFHPSINYILASGFGNGLISLLFLIAISSWLDAKQTPTLLIAALLPLLRIDAILYSSVLIILDFSLYRKIKRPLSALAASIACICCVLLFSKIYYGHWIPTPILFKSVPTALLIQNLKMFPIAVLTNSIIDFSILVFPILFITFYYRINDRKFAALSFSYGLLLLISAFYKIQARVNSPDRYYLPTFFMAILLTALGLALIAKKLESEIQLTSFKKTALTFFLIFLSVQEFQFGIESRRFAKTGFDQHSLPFPFEGLVYRTFKIVQQAEYLSTIINHKEVVATVELNTLGFFADFKVDPLWGYANRQYAKSSTIAPFAGGIRCDPTYVLNSKPDYFWVYHLPSNIESHILEDFKDGEWYQFSVNIGVASIADLANEFPNVFYIRHDNLTTCLLVPNRSTEKLISALKNKGHRLEFQRSLNGDRIREANSKNPLKLKQY